MKRRLAIAVATLLGVGALAGAGQAFGADASDACHDGIGNEAGTGVPVFGTTGVWAGIDYTHGSFGEQPVIVCYSTVRPGSTDPALVGGALKPYVYDNPNGNTGGLQCFADPGAVVGLACDYRFGVGATAGPGGVGTWTYVTGTGIPTLEVGTAAGASTDTTPPVVGVTVDGPCTPVLVNHIPTANNPLCGAPLAKVEVATGDLPVIKESGDMTIASLVTIEDIVPHVYVGDDTSNSTVTVTAAGTPVPVNLAPDCVNCTIP